MSQQHAPIWSPGLYALGVPPLWAAWVLLLWWDDYCGESDRHSWLPVQLVARPRLVQRLLAAIWQGWVIRQLIVEPWGAPGLLLAHWCVEVGSRRSQSLCLPKSWGYCWPTGRQSWVLGSGCRAHEVILIYRMRIIHLVPRD